MILFDKVKIDEIRHGSYCDLCHAFLEWGAECVESKVWDYGFKRMEKKLLCLDCIGPMSQLADSPVGASIHAEDRQEYPEEE